MTAGHNIYSEPRGEFCTEARFFPNLNNSPLGNSSYYKSKRGHFHRCQYPTATFSSLPIESEICLIALEEALDEDIIIAIGNLPGNEEKDEDRTKEDDRTL